MKQVVRSWIRQHYDEVRQRTPIGRPDSVIFLTVLHKGRALDMYLFDDFTRVFHSPKNCEIQYADPDLYQKLTTIINYRLGLKQNADTNSDD